MKKYVVTRKKVCAGKLVIPCDVSTVVLDQNNQEIKEEEYENLGIPKVSASGGIICRGMLFKVNENNLATDLIYTTPTKYTINGIESDLADGTSKFIIDDYVELDELLKYLKYGDDLTQHDLNKIYKKFIINNRWLNHHMKLFGWKKLKYGIYGIGGREVISKDIYDNLKDISCFRNGTPHCDEPGYQLIKKK